LGIDRSVRWCAQQAAFFFGDCHLVVFLVKFSRSWSWFGVRLARQEAFNAFSRVEWLARETTPANRFTFSSPSARNFTTLRRKKRIESISVLLKVQEFKAIKGQHAANGA
jgi:hypothetical protein